MRGDFYSIRMKCVLVRFLVFEKSHWIAPKIAISAVINSQEHIYWLQHRIKNACFLSFLNTKPSLNMLFTSHTNLVHDSKWPNFISHSQQKTSRLESRRRFSAFECSIWMAKLFKSRVRVCVGRACVSALYKRTFSELYAECLCLALNSIQVWYS